MSKVVSQERSDKCFAQGRKTEELYAKAKGLGAYIGSEYDDKILHVDVWWYEDLILKGAQVKAFPNDGYETYMVVELKARLQPERGSGTLYVSKADIHAYEREDCFIEVDRKELVEWVEKHITHELATDKMTAIARSCMYIRKSDGGDHWLGYIHSAIIKSLPSTKILMKN